MSKRSRLGKLIDKAITDLQATDRGHWSQAAVFQIVLQQVKADIELIDLAELVADAVATDDRRRLSAEGQQIEMFVPERPLVLGNGERVLEARASEDDTIRNHELRRDKETERRSGWDRFDARRTHERRVFALQREAGVPLKDQGEMYAKGFGYRQQSFDFGKTD